MTDIPYQGDVVSAFIRGQLNAFNRVLALLNTADTMHIEKEKLWKQVFDMRPEGNFQERAAGWVSEAFSDEVAADALERNHRFLEEALELVQSLGCLREDAHQLVDYTFDRPIGEPSQEVGGVMVTLAGLCAANKLDLHDAGEIELERCWSKIDAIREKQARKKKDSALPGTTMKFFEFDQNNSGGSFMIDDNAGLGPRVWIEARDPADANRKAEHVGIDPEGPYCKCCGPRWDYVSECDGEDHVRISERFDFGWHDKVYIHRASGKIERISVDDAKTLPYVMFAADKGLL